MIPSDEVRRFFWMVFGDANEEITSSTLWIDSVTIIYDDHE
ncbi:hypothetical protein QA601_07235 [Chitinispirillales bacterium ANBcel5]|nr:hypothetical protein [Chitinispirillales bacterium ANBcel5]